MEGRRKPFVASTPSMWWRIDLVSAIMDSGFDGSGDEYLSKIGLSFKTITETQARGITKKLNDENIERKRQREK